MQKEELNVNQEIKEEVKLSPKELSEQRKRIRENMVKETSYLEVENKWLKAKIDNYYLGQKFSELFVNKVSTDNKVTPEEDTSKQTDNQQITN